MRFRKLPFFFLLAFVIISGCSGNGQGPIAPTGEIARTSEGASHSIWGMWQMAADPVAGTLDITPARMADMHVNVLPFLEPPVLLNLTLESLQFNGNIIEADIGLRHPFIGLTEFTGFDVCGILISNGSVASFSDPDLRMTGNGDTRLLNPDGYSRWWNPSEFPADGTMFGYKDGLLGTPDSVANFNSTLNGYKYYCDDLTNPDDPMSIVNALGRAVFTPGNKNVRHYSIELGAEGLVFNYAVDASWQFPQGNPPYQAPEDFAPGANRAEPWNINVTELDNTLFNAAGDSGGGLSLAINVYDWSNADANTVRVESAGGDIPATESSTITGGGDGYSTYEIDIQNCTPSAPGDLGLLITVESDALNYGGLLPGKVVSAYFVYTTTVSSEQTMIWSDEFEVANTDNARFPVIDQTPAGDVIAGWSSNPGIQWSKFDGTATWTSPSYIDATADAAWMSIDRGFSGNDIYLQAGYYAGTTVVNGVTFEIGSPKVWRWDGATNWDYWSTNISNCLHSHYYNDFENKHHILDGTDASYGHPMHLQWSAWGQYYTDYFQDYYECCNMSEYGYSRCWDDDSNGYMWAAYEADRMKGIYLPKIDYRYVKVAVQYLPTVANGEYASFTIDEGSNDYLDSPVLAVDSNDIIHAVYRRYIDSTSTWQIIHRWSNTGTSWSSGQETVIWSGATEPEWRYVSMDIDTLDRIHVTFTEGNKVWYTRCDDGFNWLTLERVNETFDTTTGKKDIQQWMVVDKDNQVHVIWARMSDVPGTEYGHIWHRWRNAMP